MKRTEEWKQSLQVPQFNRNFCNRYGHILYLYWRMPQICSGIMVHDEIMSLSQPLSPTQYICPYILMMLHHPWPSNSVTLELEYGLTIMFFGYTLSVPLFLTKLQEIKLITSLTWRGRSAKAVSLVQSSWVTGDPALCRPVGSPLSCSWTKVLQSSDCGHEPSPGLKTIRSRAEGR